MIDFCSNWKWWRACGSGSESPELNISAKESRFRACSQTQFCTAPAVQPLQLAGTMAGDILLSGTAQGHRTDQPQHHRLCTCPGCHTFLGLTKTSPGHQCLAARSPSTAGAANPLLCSIRTRADPEMPGYVKTFVVAAWCRDSLPKLPHSRAYWLPGFLLHSPHFSVPPPGQLPFPRVQRSPKTYEKITKWMSPPECPALCSPIFWISHSCLLKEWVFDVPYFSR